MELKGTEVDLDKLVEQIYDFRPGLAKRRDMRYAKLMRKLKNQITPAGPIVTLERLSEPKTDMEHLVSPDKMKRKIKGPSTSRQLIVRVKRCRVEDIEPIQEKNLPLHTLKLRKSANWQAGFRPSPLTDLDQHIDEENLRISKLKLQKTIEWHIQDNSSPLIAKELENSASQAKDPNEVVTKPSAVTDPSQVASTASQSNDHRQDENSAVKDKMTQKIKRAIVRVTRLRVEDIEQIQEKEVENSASQSSNPGEVISNPSQIIEPRLVTSSSSQDSDPSGVVTKPSAITDPSQVASSPSYSNDHSQDENSAGKDKIRVEDIEPIQEKNLPLHTLKLRKSANWQAGFRPSPLTDLDQHIDEENLRISKLKLQKTIEWHIQDNSSPLIAKVVENSASQSSNPSQVISNSSQITDLGQVASTALQSNDHTRDENSASQAKEPSEVVTKPSAITDPSQVASSPSYSNDHSQDENSAAEASDLSEVVTKPSQITDPSPDANHPSQSTDHSHAENQQMPTEDNPSTLTALNQVASSQSINHSQLECPSSQPTDSSKVESQLSQRIDKTRDTMTQSLKRASIPWQPIVQVKRLRVEEIEENLPLQTLKLRKRANWQAGIRPLPLTDLNQDIDDENLPISKLKLHKSFEWHIENNSSPLIVKEVENSASQGSNPCEVISNPSQISEPRLVTSSSSQDSDPSGVVTKPSPMTDPSQVASGPSHSDDHTQDEDSASQAKDTSEVVTKPSPITDPSQVSSTVSLSNDHAQAENSASQAKVPSQVVTKPSPITEPSHDASNPSQSTEHSHAENQQKPTENVPSTLTAINQVASSPSQSINHTQFECPSSQPTDYNQVESHLSPRTDSNNSEEENLPLSKLKLHIRSDRPTENHPPALPAPSHFSEIATEMEENLPLSKLVRLERAKRRFIPCAAPIKAEGQSPPDVSTDRSEIRASTPFNEMSTPYKSEGCFATPYPARKGPIWRIPRRREYNVDEVTACFQRSRLDISKTENELSCVENELTEPKVPVKCRTRLLQAINPPPKPPPKEIKPRAPRARRPRRPRPRRPRVRPPNETAQQTFSVIIDPQARKKRGRPRKRLLTAHESAPHAMRVVVEPTGDISLNLDLSSWQCPIPSPVVEKPRSPSPFCGFTGDPLDTADMPSLEETLYEVGSTGTKVSLDALVEQVYYIRPEPTTGRNELMGKLKSQIILVEPTVSLEWLSAASHPDVVITSQIPLPSSLKTPISQPKPAETSNRKKIPIRKQYKILMEDLALSDSEEDDEVWMAELRRCMRQEPKESRTACNAETLFPNAMQNSDVICIPDSPDGDSAETLGRVAPIDGTTNGLNLKLPPNEHRCGRVLQPYRAQRGEHLSQQFFGFENSEHQTLDDFDMGTANLLNQLYSALYSLHPTGDYPPQGHAQNTFSSLQPQRATAAMPSKPQPSKAAKPAKPRRSTAAVPSKPRRSNAAIPRQPRRSNAAIPRQPRRSNAAIPRQPQGFIANIPSQPQGFTANIPSQPQRSTAAIPAHPQRSTAAIPSKPRLFTADIPPQPQRPIEAIPSHPQLFSANIPSQPQKFTAAIATQPQRSPGAIPLQPHLSTADNFPQPQRPMAAIPSHSQLFTADIPSQPHRVTANIPSQPQEFTAAIPTQPKRSTTAVPSQPHGFTAHISSQPQRITADIPRQPQGSTAAVPSKPRGFTFDNFAQLQRMIADIPPQQQRSTGVDELLRMKPLNFSTGLSGALHQTYQVPNENRLFQKSIDFSPNFAGTPNETYIGHGLRPSQPQRELGHFQPNMQCGLAAFSLTSAGTHASTINGTGPPQQVNGFGPCFAATSYETFTCHALMPSQPQQVRLGQFQPNIECGPAGFGTHAGTINETGPPQQVIGPNFAAAPYAANTSHALRPQAELGPLQPNIECFTLAETHAGAINRKGPQQQSIGFGPNVAATANEAYTQGCDCSQNQAIVTNAGLAIDTTYGLLQPASNCGTYSSLEIKTEISQQISVIRHTEQRVVDHLLGKWDPALPFSTLPTQPHQPSCENGPSLASTEDEVIIISSDEEEQYDPTSYETPAYSPWYSPDYTLESILSYHHN